MTYIFDFDGMLVDSMPTFSSVMTRMFDENNIKCPDDFVNIITPLEYQGTAEYAISLGMDISIKDFIGTAVKYSEPEYFYNIPTKDSVKEALTRLKAEGNSLNVLTASPHNVLDASLKRVGLFELFDNVWSCDDFNLPKSDTKIYLEASKKLNKDIKDCCFVDYNIGAISTAKKAGMRTIGVYDSSSKAYKAEIMKTADKYIYSFKEIWYQ